MCCRNTLITCVSAWLGHKQTQHTDHISIFGFRIVRVLSFWFFQGQDMRKKSLLKHQPRLDEAFFSVWQGAGPGHGILPDCQGMVKRMREAYPTIYTYFPCVHACIHPSMFISLSSIYAVYIISIIFYIHIGMMFCVYQHVWSPQIQAGFLLNITISRVFGECLNDLDQHGVNSSIFSTHPGSLYTHNW